jgi:hypothetical protein
LSQPFDRYAGQPTYGWAPGPVPPGAWSPYAGAPWPPPAPPRRRKAVVAWAIGGSLLAVAVLVVIAVGGFRMGSTQMSGAFAAPPTEAPADWTAIGDDEGFDAYAERCYDGTMRACDELYELAEIDQPGSRYAYYGLTCGGRVHPRDVFTCTALD